MKTTLSLLLVLGLALSLSAAPLTLDRSTIIEAVNQVERIETSAGKVEPAVLHSELRAPDRLRTGRKSRAELEAADGTITRLGANTVFAFEAEGRDLLLEQGSLLFHSPTGRGGGRIRSSSASATVMGTTLIAAATPDGGYKLLVLEGHARVDFAGGASLELAAGQMTFVRPALDGVGKMGPVLQFDLERQVRSSKLIGGFERPLPSMPRIENAIREQARAVSSGQYTTTGFLVYTATSDTQVNGIETKGPDADDRLTGDFTAAQKLALDTNLTLNTPELPQAHLFRTPLIVPASESPFLNKETDAHLTGLFANKLLINTPAIDLTTWQGPSTFNMVAKTSITLGQTLEFQNLGAVDFIRLFSPIVSMPNEGTILVTFLTDTTTGTATTAGGYPVNGEGGKTGTFYIDTDQSLELQNVIVRVLGGGLILQSHSGDLALLGGDFLATLRIGAPLVVPCTINLDAPNGRLIVDGSLFDTNGGNFAANGKTVTIHDTKVFIGRVFWLNAVETIDLHTIVFSAAGDRIFQATSGDLANLRSLSLAGFSQVNIGARTIVLDTVSFDVGSTVRLVSEKGLLAPNPNTNQVALPGYVNFVRDVTYGGDAAQDHVATEAGGTGLLTPMIQISKPTP